MTDQEKLEKVIKALECRLDINGSKYKHCLSCDYRHNIDHCQWTCQTDGILEDTLALLKAQEPRVMTLEEVDALGDDDIVWIECLYPVDVKNIATLKPAIYQPENSLPEEDGYYCVVSSWGKSGFYHKDSYMVDWRCWTSRPDEKRRAETLWQQ